MNIYDDYLIDSEYSEDILRYLRAKEKKRRTFLRQSPQLTQRRYLVDWLALISEQIKLCRTTQHLCIYLLDYFMDQHDIEYTRLQLVGLGCLLVASKFDEKDSRVPRTSDLNRFVNNAYKLSDFVLMELVLLEFFNWDLTIPTAANFTQYYTKYALIKNDLHFGRPLQFEQKAEVYVRQYIAYFLDVSLQDSSFLDCNPSSVASACVAATRISLSLTPVWPQILQSVTGYNYEDISNCINLLLRALECDEKAQRQSEENNKTGNDSGEDDEDKLTDSPGGLSTTSNVSSECFAIR